MKRNFRYLTIVLGLSFTILLSGCIGGDKKDVPQDLQWGRKGHAPTAVWMDWDWEIRVKGQND